MPYSLGTEAKEVFRWGPEAHKLHLEFKVNGDVNAGQPVKLHTENSTVTALGDGDAENLCIGVSLHTNKSAYGDYVVVATRGYSVVMMELGANLVAPGPIQYNGFNTTTGYSKVVTAASAGQAIGWSLVSGSAGDIVPVLIKD